MIKEHNWLVMSDQTEIYTIKWYDPEQKPIAIVQIAHGMAEHIERYDDFARFLVQKGMIVFGHDHRGHGKTGEKQGQLGYLDDEDGFTKLTTDLYELTTFLQKDYEDIPFFLFGHSMGSFIVRYYIQQYSPLVRGVLLSGTGYYPRSLTYGARLLANMLPPKEKSPIMYQLAFGAYNRKIDDFQTKLDWLSSVDEVVDQYMKDPYCGFIPTARFFYDLMTGLFRIHQTTLNRHIRKDLPLFLLSGHDDPVGDYGKGVWKVAEDYYSLGLRHIKTMLFENARHEILNEWNKVDVYAVIEQWIKQQLSF